MRPTVRSAVAINCIAAVVISNGPGWGGGLADDVLTPNGWLSGQAVNR